ncbi:hypothetical protein [Burkholderia sp. 8Y]|uniref:hypothetical protein n=1 Tax=Burkholderia sp. 8Y TaxID=2653133 RepID=UPI0013585D38|nr:hypothetical protein [Burkholderia sp. 8Y]
MKLKILEPHGGAFDVVRKSGPFYTTHAARRETHDVMDGDARIEPRKRDYTEDAFDARVHQARRFE